MSGIASGRVDVVLHEVGLISAADQRAGTFSLGMRQRLALAGALLGEPDVLLLDEPSNGLDPDGIRWLRTSLRSFADHGGTVFVSSHLIAELAMFADDLVVVGAGRLLAAEAVHATMARGGSAVLVRSPHAQRLAHLLSSRGVAVDVDGDRLSLRGADHRDDLAARVRPPDPRHRDHRDRPVARGDPHRHDQCHRAVRRRLTTARPTHLEGPS